MEKAIKETERRRKIQQAYNEEHGIVPKTIIKSIGETLSISETVSEIEKVDEKKPEDIRKMPAKDLNKLIDSLTKEMKEAAKLLEFEYAAQLRDRINKLQKERR